MSRIALVISDVDGTLVTPGKQLTGAAIQAVGKLHDAGIGFTITSSRPPFGMRMFAAPLALKLPLGAFNGSSIVDPAIRTVTHHKIPEAAAVKGIELLKQAGVSVWLFTNTQWFVSQEGKDDAYVPREQYTIDTDPVFVADFAEFTADACKIVGVSADFEKLARCEAAMQQALGATASAVRSQQYYLDITPAGFDKGTFVDEMALRAGIAPDQIATIGDMQNDLAMFAKSGLSYAMGNAMDEVRAQATCRTASNEEEGFARAVDDILARAAVR